MEVEMGNEGPELLVIVLMYFNVMLIGEKHSTQVPRTREDWNCISFSGLNDYVSQKKGLRSFVLFSHDVRKLFRKH
jgi:hypothetical protein